MTKKECIEIELGNLVDALEIVVTTTKELLYNREEPDIDEIIDYLNNELKLAKIDLKKLKEA